MNAVTAAASAVAIRGLVKRFPQFTLGPLDLTVPEGAIYGLIGPNGAGKTTTLDLIMGMGAGEAGSIEIFGLDHASEEVAVKLRTGYVSPELSYNAWRHVGRLMNFLKPFYPTWDDAYCTHLLYRFNLNAEDRITTLSLGQRTRLALVAALAHRPDLLILDEPTTGLDAIAKRQLFDEMLDLMQEERRTVLISSHNLTDLERLADHVGLISEGKLLLEGSVDGLLERFRMIDLRLPARVQPREVQGLRLLRREGDRLRVLLDSCSPAAMQTLEPFEILDRAPLTLEDLFIALVGNED